MNFLKRRTPVFVAADLSAPAIFMGLPMPLKTFAMLSCCS
jgi:hypothetical protein